MPTWFFDATSDTLRSIVTEASHHTKFYSLAFDESIIYIIAFSFISFFLFLLSFIYILFGFLLTSKTISRTGMWKTTHQQVTIPIVTMDC